MKIVCCCKAKALVNIVLFVCTAIIAHAKSGTGKTLIYLLTALNSFVKFKHKGLFTLILAPTREIAKQIYDVCKNISTFIEGESSLPTRPQKLYSVIVSR
jgi:superfamily II DNA/RNA helicase